MSRISLKWFGGMVPRRGEQHLYRTPQATEAENCNLYSGELRPLKKPSLSHQFCRPDEECWRAPVEPWLPPEPPPEPPLCVPVAIQSQFPSTLYLGDVGVGTSITLSITVNADATAPLQYQWYRNGIAIDSAVSSVYQFTVAAEDSYAAYTATVQNPCGQDLAESWSLGSTIVCKEYACDAFESALLALNPVGYWRLNDTVSVQPQTFQPTVSSVVLTETGAVTIRQPYSARGGPDICDPYGISYTGTGNGWGAPNDQSDFEAIEITSQRLQGTLLMAYAGWGAADYAVVSYYVPYWTGSAWSAYLPQRMIYNLSSGYWGRLSFAGTGSGFVDVPGNSGDLRLVAWDFDMQPNIPNQTIDVVHRAFVDGQLVLETTVSWLNVWTFGYFDGSKNDLRSGNSNFLGQLTLVPGLLSESQHAALYQEWERSYSDYVDPTPGCS